LVAASLGENGSFGNLGADVRIILKSVWIGLLWLRSGSNDAFSRSRAMNLVLSEKSSKYPDRLSNYQLFQDVTPRSV
jgi:hypothetical protein